MHLTVSSYHVTYTFQRESTLCICLNVKELLSSKQAQYLKFKWLQRDSNLKLHYSNTQQFGRIHNHLVRQLTLNRLARLAEWLNCVASTYLYGAFDCMFS